MSILTTILSFLLAILASAAHGQGYWRIMPPPPLPTGTNITALHAHTDSLLILAGQAFNSDPVVLRSTDGGNSWTNQTAQMSPPPSVGQGPISSIISVLDTIILCQGSYLYKSADQGLTWQKFGATLSPPPQRITYDHVSNTGFAPYGSTGSFLRTFDGWNTFEWLSTGFQHIPNSVAQIGADTILLGAGQIPGHPPVAPLVISTDTGVTWNVPTGLPNNGAFIKIECIGNSCYTIGYELDSIGTSGSHRLYKSTDKGTSWSNIKPNIPNHTDYVYTDLKCLDSQSCLLAVRTVVGADAFRLFLRTTDGGQTWQRDSVTWTPAQSNPFQGIIGTNFRNSNLAYAAFITGLVIKYETQPSSVPDPNPVLVTVSPNPVDDQFTVSVIPPANGTFLLINSIGQIVINQSLSGGSTTIQRGSLPAGVYAWLVIDPNGQVIGNGQLMLL